MTAPDLTKCQCGEPIIARRILCDRCVEIVNKRAMATMKVVIEALGLGKEGKA